MQTVFLSGINNWPPSEDAFPHSRRRSQDAPAGGRSLVVSPTRRVLILLKF